MAAKSHPIDPAVRDAWASQPVPGRRLRELLAHVDERVDCADFSLAPLLLFLYCDVLERQDADEARRSVLGFRYWMDEPGRDSMCFWSENHQLLFAVEEYLAGQLYPEARFVNNGHTGAERQTQAEQRLRRWLADRFRWGFAEWHSPTYYTEHIGALALLIELADDPDLVTRASIVLDLLLLDVALHTFDGAFVGSGGRLGSAEKFHPHSADIADAHESAFAESRHIGDLTRIDAAFHLRRRYEVPDILGTIAADDSASVIRSSTGLDVAEVADHYDDPTDPETAGSQYWLMEALTHRDSIEATARALREWRLRSNAFVAPVAKALRTLPRRSGAWAQRRALTALNPVTQGTALQRANVYALRTPSYHLSSAQHYHPGEFGDQQHIWQATLRRGVTVFSTHPGSTTVPTSVRSATPNAWVGNGINPDVAQHENVLLALHDIRGRRGYLEGRRAEYTHLHFPFVDFDETTLGTDWVAGRVGDGYIGVRAVAPLSLTGTSELVQRGDQTGYAVLMGDALDYTGFRAFADVVRETTLHLEHRTLTFAGDFGRYSLRFGERLRLNGRPFPTRYPRVESPWVTADREPGAFHIHAQAHSWHLGWDPSLRGPAL